MTDIPWAALCDECEWSRTCKNDEIAKVVAVLHTVVKHPERYRSDTGKDPEEAEFMYRDLILTFKADL
jgi:hypothetical protein